MALAGDKRESSHVLQDGLRFEGVLLVEIKEKQLTINAGVAPAFLCLKFRQAETAV